MSSEGDTSSLEELEALRVVALNTGNNELAAYFKNRILERLMLAALRREREAKT